MSRRLKPLLARPRSLSTRCASSSPALRSRKPPPAGLRVLEDLAEAGQSACFQTALAHLQ